MGWQGNRLDTLGDRRDAGFTGGGERLVGRDGAAETAVCGARLAEGLLAVLDDIERGKNGDGKTLSGIARARPVFKAIFRWKTAY